MRKIGGDNMYMETNLLHDKMPIETQQKPYITSEAVVPGDNTKVIVTSPMLACKSRQLYDSCILFVVSHKL